MDEDTSPTLDTLRASLACPDCPSAVVVVLQRVGGHVVIHHALSCPAIPDPAHSAYVIPLPQVRSVRLDTDGEP